MNKDKLETIFRKAGVTPEFRHKIKDYDIFVGDGFSSPPHDKYRRFGVGKKDFSFGCYVTWWWVGKDEKLDTGQPLFFEAFHNPELGKEFKKKARVNAALQQAAGFLERREVNRKKLLNG